MDGVSSRPSSAHRLKSAIEVARRQAGNIEDITALRKRVLRGEFSKKCLGHHYEVWELRPFNLMFFGSSTFTDTQRERTSLITMIVVMLRQQLDYIGVQGIGILPVDLRWGVRDENSLEHLTWILCQKELKRCCSLSSGVFFISLQSDK